MLLISTREHPWPQRAQLSPEGSSGSSQKAWRCRLPSWDGKGLTLPSCSCWWGELSNLTDCWDAWKILLGTYIPTSERQTGLVQAFLTSNHPHSAPSQLPPHLLPHQPPLQRIPRVVPDPTLIGTLPKAPQPHHEDGTEPGRAPA